MIRTIIRIDEEKCDGCGLCAEACTEGAIAVIDGKAKLLREDYCDGLGNCLPVCPQNAISFEEREALPYDEAAVKEQSAVKRRGHRRGHLHRHGGHGRHGHGEATLACGCSADTVRALPGEGTQKETPASSAAGRPGRLSQWPVQIKLLPVQAPFYDGADLLVAADCTAYAYNGFHDDFIKGRITAVGCPKLDGVDYGEKLGEILAANDIRSVTLTRMEVPCCGGIVKMAKKAIAAAGKDLPLRVVTITAEGAVLKEETTDAGR